MYPLLALMLALARAIPALDSLFSAVVAERGRDREREASQRLAEKDGRVDAAIDDQVKP